MAVLNKDSLLNFIIDFDPIKKKYEHDNIILDLDTYKSIYEFERKRQFAYVFKREYDISYDNVKLIYNSTPEEANHTVNIYVNTRKKIIEQYINIKGLEQLFSEIFLEFEWDMHSRIKFEERKYDFYRDHFIHQIRNMYELDVMLDNFDFLVEIRTVIFSNMNNKVCRYINNQVNLEIERICSNHSEKEIWKKLFENSTPSEKEFERWLKNNIVDIFTRQSCYTSALFHDIGYPIAHAVNINKRIFDYISDIYSSSFGNKDFQEIEKSLANSMLFQMVKNDEIKELFEGLDHGVMSAIVFLLHFYENGSLSSLTPLQIAVIEISALAMYNHNLKYQIMDENESFYFRPVFENNPISFLLRVADEVEEWDRVYFEFKDDKNFIFCEHCKSPIIHTKINLTKDSRKMKDLRICRGNFRVALNDSKLEQFCTYNNGLNINCKKQNCFSDTFVDQSIFQTRSMSIIKMCNEAEYIKKYGLNIISIKYDPYLLLLRTLSDPHFSEYTCKAFRNLKKMIHGQTNIYVDYFLTSNPISLKVKVLQKYMFYWMEKERKTDINNEIFEEFFSHLDELVKEIKIEKNNRMFYFDLLRRVKFYFDLLKFWFNPNVYSKKGILRNIIRTKVFSSVYDDAVSDLEHFPFYGFTCEMSENNEDINHRKYLEAERKKKSEDVLDNIALYTQVVFGDCIPNIKGKRYIDFYSDLYFLKLINDKIEK